MESMTLQPMAAPQVSIRRALASFMGGAEAFGTMPSAAARAALRCSWSLHTNDTNAIRTAKGHKAYGARRLGEAST